jgi:hypothetical protein
MLKLRIIVVSRSNLMIERIRTETVEMDVPCPITEEWIEEFNDRFAYREYTTTVRVQDWLEQPDHVYGSGYFTLEDEMGDDGWWQGITGNVHNATYTNVPHYQDTSFVHVLALTDARLQEQSGNERLLADGRLVLVRLDRLPSIVLRQQIETVTT